jgi:Mce-associated membrane protein
MMMLLRRFSPPDKQVGAPIEAEPDTCLDADAFGGEPTDEAADTAPRRQGDSQDRVPPVRLGLTLCVVVAIALTALVGWLAVRTYESHHAQRQRELFVQAARQGALNLTTIDWQHAEADVKRVLDGATGGFYDDFAKRSQPFLDVVKQSQASSVGSITEAGLESGSDSTAQVLVAVSVKTSNAGAPHQNPRAWRMRISVQKVGGEAKVSNVEFVP